MENTTVGVIPQDVHEIIDILRDQMPSYMSERLIESMNTEFNLQNPELKQLTDKEFNDINLQQWNIDEEFGSNQKSDTTVLPREIWILRGNDEVLHDYSVELCLDRVEYNIRDIFLQNKLFQIKYRWKTPMIDFQDHYLQIIKGDISLLLLWTTT